MRKHSIAVFGAILLTAVTAGAQQEGTIFHSQGCATCHKTEVSKTYPSLQDIAHAYQGNEDQLLGYLKGEAQAIIEPTEASRMKRYIEKTKSLSDAERKALADFIMSHGK
jgi:cytochrome c551/c552